jgi:broad specificity phosphatase PhoE
MTTRSWARGVRRIFASSERKARDAAQIFADALGLGGYSVIAKLGENDRSATGFLAKDEFEATVDAFFAQPLKSIRGWEPAADAQARIVGAVEEAVFQTLETRRMRLLEFLRPTSATAHAPGLCPRRGF